MEILLTIHILAGTVSLIAMAVAIFSAKGRKLHIFSGRIYFWGMLVIFLTATLMSFLNGNIFLFLIAIFSFYFAFAGMRFAKNRKGNAKVIDWIAVGLMICSGVGMLILSAIYFMSNNSQYIILIVFGFLAVILGYIDFTTYRNKKATGKKRIARHLTNMMAGAISVITAVLVVNVDIEPAWIWWILPTVVITPVIIWWNVQFSK